MNTYWFSFVDEKFLGVAIIDAENLRQAHEKTFQNGCNPGGEAQIIELYDCQIDDKHKRKLLSKEYLKEHSLID
jgi:hypothetical protein